jgi:hypothetical protein
MDSDEKNLKWNVLDLFEYYNFGLGRFSIVWGHLNKSNKNMNFNIINIKNRIYIYMGPKWLRVKKLSTTKLHISLSIITFLGCFSIRGTFKMNFKI